jgi:hypothetical protein
VYREALPQHPVACAGDDEPGRQALSGLSAADAAAPSLAAAEGGTLEAEVLEHGLPGNVWAVVAAGGWGAPLHAKEVDVSVLVRKSL